jgi:hypothetical protein
MPDTGADAMPAALPDRRAAPTPVRHTPRKQKQRVIGYGITGAPSRRVFRVT